MSKKKVVSVRLASKPGDRMTSDEWEAFSTLTSYFGLNASQLVEAALCYAHDVSAGNARYSFNEIEFERMCGSIPNLSALTPSLRNGRLDTRASLSAPSICAALPVGTILRYYPPYIISAEPTMHIRINIDLSEPLEIQVDEASLKIMCGKKQRC
jgi:hypothetical protein